MTKSHNHEIVANFVCCDVSDRYIVTLMPTILGGFVESIYIIIFGVVSFVFDAGGSGPLKLSALNRSNPSDRIYL